MNTKNRGAVKLFSALGVAGLGVLILTYASVQQSSRQFVQVSELKENSSRMDGKRIKVSGTVVKGSVEHKPAEFHLAFTIKGKEKGKTTRVIHEGTKPDAFREKGVAIVEGRYDADRDQIQTTNLMAKCPSRYDKEFKKNKNSDYDKTEYKKSDYSSEQDRPEQ